VLLHAVRAPIGAGFLVELARGALPSAFAQRAGFGDIVVGLTALVVAALTGPALAGRRRAVVLVWNAIGLADILVVVATASRLTLTEHDARMLAAFARPAYALLPLCIVPVVIVTHTLVFVRALAPRTRHARARTRRECQASAASRSRAMALLRVGEVI
jgi:Na+/phosphate symporter